MYTQQGGLDDWDRVAAFVMQNSLHVNNANVTRTKIISPHVKCIARHQIIFQMRPSQRIAKSEK